MGKLIDLSGKRFGRLLVISIDPVRVQDCIKWICKCDCGKEASVFSYYLRTGQTKSCGCLRDELGSYKLIDITGRKFGRLTVIKRNPVNGKDGDSMWDCKCSCGKDTVTAGAYLRNGDTKSCGCYKIDVLTKHGLYDHPIMQTWQNMLSRCEYEKANDYMYYGAKGVLVCSEWHKIRSFYEWAISNGYQTGLQIHRKDTNGNYEPQNCEWLPKREHLQLHSLLKNKCKKEENAKHT